MKEVPMTAAALQLDQNNNIAPQLLNENPSASTFLSMSKDGRVKIGSSFTPTSEKKLTAHEHLYLEGDRQTHIYQVLEGVVGSYHMLPDGRRQIAKFYYPGDLIGVAEQAQFATHAEALSASKVRCIPISCIDSLILTEPGFGRALLSLVATDLSDTREQLLSLGRKTALEKVASFLFNIYSRNNVADTDSENNDVAHVPMTRSEIADYLGLTIETVSRCITKLKTSGVIKPETRSTIRILNPDQLEEISVGEESEVR